MSRPIIGIYKITNKINGKCYIGQSVNIKERWRKHRTVAKRNSGKDCHKPLYCAIRKYGVENFSFEILEECSKEELNDKEIYWIAYYNSCNSDNGYNLTKGGGNTGEGCKKLTEQQVQEIRQKILNGQSQTSIAKEYGVSQVVISYINSGVEYYHEDWDYPIKVFQPLRGKGFCVDCGKAISSGARRCRDCFDKNRSPQKTTKRRTKKRIVTMPPISREELKDLIRNKPFTQIGSQFNCTDNCIRKWCDRLNLPRRKRDINSYSDEEWEKI